MPLVLHALLPRPCLHNWARLKDFYLPLRTTCQQFSRRLVMAAIRRDPRAGRTGACMSRITLAVLSALYAISAAALDNPGAQSSRFFEHMLKKWDTNGDGRISLDEYLAAAASRFQQID